MILVRDFRYEKEYKFGLEGGAAYLSKFLKVPHIFLTDKAQTMNYAYYVYIFMKILCIFRRTRISETIWRISSMLFTVCWCHAQQMTASLMMDHQFRVCKFLG